MEEDWIAVIGTSGLTLYTAGKSGGTYDVYTTRKRLIAAKITVGALNFMYAGAIYRRRAFYLVRQQYLDIAGVPAF
jgi:hypothetical protein